MAYCTSCGSSIPDNQDNSCSMCYGDISYGTDGYYKSWAEEQLQEQKRKAEEEEYQEQHRDDF